MRGAPRGSDAAGLRFDEYNPREAALSLIVVATAALELDQAFGLARDRPLVRAMFGCGTRSTNDGEVLPKPKPMAVLVPTRLPGDERDPETEYEQAGTVAELLAGVVALVFSVVLFRAGS